ncbi:chromatin structure-remodeling complex protein SYD-like [Rhododendron vialii]|uniref:chromatin structure-remodeling complex protein SYD-like n=1 Tax=Rhododendron vialii TaxID=182163 RepID=UPI00265E8561|nr:chromatin structure-remodeling complex protein SYD-like [Rhododendron vialii]
MAAPPNNVELEAAKFLHKLIQESKDEPKKLATKLYVILQHMRSSGKENSMPYQVISRAMETVINEHGLDIDALKSSRGPLTGGTHMGDSSSAQFAGSSQTAAMVNDSKSGMAEYERTNPQASSRPPVGPSAAGHDIYQGSVSHPGSKSFDHESPSSYDTKSANSQSQERHDPALDKPNQDDSKKASSKRKRADSSSTTEPHIENSQQLDNCNLNARKGKMANKVEPPRSLPIRGSEHSQFNMVQGSGQMEHIPPLPASMRSTNLASSMQQSANPKYREEIEVSSAHSALALQQGGSRLSPHDILNSRALWSQNRTGSSLENTQVPRFPSNAISSNSTAEMFMHQSIASLGSGASVHGASPGSSGSFPLVESGVSNPGNNIEMNMHRGAAPRDTGKSAIFQATGVSNMPFKEQHLKQLRAQCLVFLAFRNRMMPKKLHLEIALGNFSPKEDGPSKEMIDNRGTELSINDQNNIPEGTMLFGRQNDLRESDIVRQGTTSTGLLPEAILLKDSKGPNTIQEMEESKEFLLMGSQPDSSSARTLAVSYDKDHLDKVQAGITNKASAVEGVSTQMKLEMVPLESMSHRKDTGPSQSQIPADCNIQQNQNADSHLTSFTLSDDRKPISGKEAEQQMMVPLKDANVLAKNVFEGSKYVSEDAARISDIQRRSIPDGSKAVVVDDTWKNGSPTVVKTRQLEQGFSLGTDLPPAPKYTTSEKWIMEQQKRKLVIEQNWALKQKKTEQRIAACSEKLKENVSSSEDISAKTKSVIELKKVQLLELQRRLRSDILNDFFKPISTDMERLKSVKKTRIGRRSKLIERYEQRQKEERQNRIRVRQKEFFSEIELHRERVDDAFKMKRERWKGFNKYVREFHKRKERFHREKIDRIQREKINLLKINDVEGYLRMVQDAKSDRVKQLLKETEKYLQKLGSKLRDAKAMARQFETDVEDNRVASVDNTEFGVENEDETDQAKHYLESNEKYYLMAHSIKEGIMEQPSCLVGGKLREYQMNGLRWLLSLYNNHLNGILADEMGLGKTVQVISLICYLMETKNDRGPFLVVVPSSVLPGWETEINFWAPSINRIVYSGTPEERRRLFKERIVQQKFNVLLTTYEYLMNKHDRPKLSKVHWHYIIIDEGHRIKNASCKLNADLKHYQSSHRLLLTGTPLQNNLEELWALLNFLLPNIFNSSEDFSQWFNKPFESNGDNSADQALLSEEENLLIINRLHQVLRPFVLRRLKHKVENQLPEKIERLVRCEASSYQKLLMKRVEDNLGAIGTSKARSVHNSVMELRNICNHPYLSQLHVEEVHDFVPEHYLPNVVRLCGKLEMLDRLLPKLKATDHRVLFFSTMTRLLDVMEDYLCWKQYRYLRLDGHTSGGDRGALIDQFNQPASPFFIFLLSIRAGGVGVNLQAADTVIIFDTDWNPQVDLQAQARAHRIGQKKDVLVLRLETVQTVEEQVRAAAEHKLGVANQSITAGFFDNNTSAEDRREYLESLLRECKKEEAAPVLDDDSLNDLIARSESEIDIFEAMDRQRLEEEMAMWKKLLLGQGKNGSEPIPPLPSRLLTDEELKLFYEAIKTYEASNARVASDVGANVGAKRKSGGLGGLDTQHYGRGKRAREVRSYEEQWTEEEFEKLCQAESPESPKPKEEVIERNSPIVSSGSVLFAAKTEVSAPLPVVSPQAPTELPPVQQTKEVTPPSKRGRGRPKRVKPEISPPAAVLPALSRPVSIFPAAPAPVPNPLPNTAVVQSVTGTIPQFEVWIAPSSESKPPPPSASPEVQSTSTPPSAPLQVKGQNRKTRRGKNQASLPPVVQAFPAPSGTGNTEMIIKRETVSSFPRASCLDSSSSSSTAKNMSMEQGSVSHSILPASTETVGTKLCSEVPPVSDAIPVLIDSTRTVKTEVVSEVQPGSSNLMVPASVQTVRTEVVSEVQTVSINPMVPVPVSFSASSIATGVAGTMPHFGVGIGPSSQPNTQSTYNAIGSQSINPSPPVPKEPKGRGRGRGRKPQSEVEAPLRRGRRRGSVAPVGEDPNSNERPQSQPQVSSGRKSIGTRRKRQNEALERTDVKAQEKGPLPASGNSAILSDKNDSPKVDLKMQETKEPSPEKAIVSESKVAGSKSLEAKVVSSILVTAGAVFDSAIASEPMVREFATKINAGLSVDGEDSGDLVDKNSTLKTEMKGTSAVPLSADPLVDMTCDKPPSPDASVLETGASVLETAASVLDLKMDKCEDQSGKGDVKKQKMVGSSPDDVVVSETVETNNLEGGKVSASSTLETNVPVVEPVTEETQKEVDAAQEINDPILPEVVDSDSEAREPEAKINVGSFENVDNLRDPVKEDSIVETSVEGTSAVPLGVDPVDVVSFERSLSLETRIDAGSFENVDNPRDPVKEDSIVETSVEGTSVVPLVVDPVDVVPCERSLALETRIDAGSFENVNNPRDPIKEELIVETCVEGTSAVVPLDVDPLEAVPCERSLALDASVLETEVSVSSSTLDTFFDKSGKEDTKVLDMLYPVRDDAAVSEPGERESLEEKKFSTLSRLEPEAPGVDTEVEKAEMDVDAEALESHDSPEACEPKAMLEVVRSQTLANSTDLVEEKSVMEDNVDCTSVVNAEPLDDMPCDEPPAPGLLVLEPAASVSDLPMHCDDQSGKEDAKEQEIRGPIEDNVVVAEEKKFVTWSTLEKSAPVDSGTEMIEKNFVVEAQESSDPVLQDAFILNPKVSETETNIDDGSFETVADPEDLVEENLIVETNVEGTSDVPESVEPSDDMPCEKPPAVDVSHLDECEEKGMEEAEEQKLEGPLVDEAIVPEVGVVGTKGSEQDGPGVDPETGKTSKIVNAEAQESNNPILVETVVLKPEGCEPESKLESLCSENAADPRDVSKENSTGPSENVPHENQSGNDDMILDKWIDSESASNEDRILEERAPICETSSPREIPETQLNAGCSEDVRDSEQPITEERKDELQDNGLVLEAVVTEDQSLEGEASTQEIQLNVCSSGNVGDSDLDLTMGRYEDQSGNEDMIRDKQIDSESASIEDRILEERTPICETSSPREIPETQLNAGGSEDVRDSEQPITEEMKDEVQDNGLVLEAVVTEDQSLEGEASTQEIQLNVGSSGNVGDSKPVIEEKKDSVLEQGLVLEPTATENQSLGEKPSILATHSPVVDPPLESPATQLNAGSSENIGDSEPTAEERIDTVLNKRLVSEPVATENQSLEEKTSDLETNSLVVDPHENPEIQLNVGSSEIVGDSEQLCKEEPIMGTHMEVDPVAPLHPISNDDVPQKELVNPDVSLPSSPLGSSSIQMDAALEEKTSNLVTNSPVVDPHEKPETQLNVGSSATLGDSEQLHKDEPITGTHMEVDPVVHLHPISIDDVPQKEPINPDVSLPSSPLGSSSIQMDAALETEVAKDSPSTEDSKAV